MIKYIIDKETGQVRTSTESSQHIDAAKEANRVEAFEQGRLTALEEFSTGRAVVSFNLETRTLAISSRAKALYPKTVAELEKAAKRCFETLEEEDQLDLLPPTAP